MCIMRCAGPEQKKRSNSMTESGNMMDNRRWRAAVVTLSDKGAAGEREDKSGPLSVRCCEGPVMTCRRAYCFRMNRKKLKSVFVHCAMMKKWISFLLQEEPDSPRATVLRSDDGSGDQKCAGNRRGHAPRVPEDHSESNAQQRCFRDTELYADHQSAGKPEGGEGEP